MLTRRTVLAAGAIGLAGGPHALAAADPFPPGVQEAVTALTREGRYLPLWTLAQSGKAPAGFRDFLEQSCAYVGDETRALARAGSGKDAAPDLSRAVAEPAVAAIARASRGRRVVMLNEAHVASRHRLFLAQLLRALRREGFTHLAAETFASDPPYAAQVAALRAGDPLRFVHGSYIADPVYAEAVREALALGFRLVSYEQRLDQASASQDPKARIPVREQAQADNLAAALAREPGARFVVFVGYGHLDEREDTPGGPWFAVRLKRATGLDPLTIGQAQSGSFGPHAPDNPITAAVLARFALRTPSLVTLDGAPVAGARWSGDLTVYHPNLPDVDGRPGWLAADRGRRRVIARAPDGEGPRLLQALPQADPDPAIPADQFALPPGVDRGLLLLRPGAYRLRLETAEGVRPLRSIRVS